MLRQPRLWLFMVLLSCCVSPAWSGNSAEYQFKAAFLYNFTTYTEWPAETGSTLNMCIYGQDSFGDDLDKLQGKTVGDRQLSVQRINELNRLADCQIIFIARSANDELPQLLNTVKGKPVLTVADTPGAASLGVILNMGTYGNRVTFEANLASARSNGLRLSSKLLKLATQVLR